jgi:hypothetical protein
MALTLPMILVGLFVVLAVLAAIVAGGVLLFLMARGRKDGRGDDRR